jgi:hypothetical protein
MGGAGAVPALTGCTGAALNGPAGRCLRLARSSAKCNEAGLATAREVMRRAMAWRSDAADKRLQKQMMQGRAADARDKAKTGTYPTTRMGPTAHGGRLARRGSTAGSRGMIFCLRFIVPSRSSGNW